MYEQDEDFEDDTAKQDFQAPNQEDVYESDHAGNVSFNMHSVLPEQLQLSNIAGVALELGKTCLAVPYGKEVIKKRHFKSRCIQLKEGDQEEAAQVSLYSLQEHS